MGQPFRDVHDPLDRLRDQLRVVLQDERGLFHALGGLERERGGEPGSPCRRLGGLAHGMEHGDRILSRHHPMTFHGTLLPWIDGSNPRASDVRNTSDTFADRVPLYYRV